MGLAVIVNLKFFFILRNSTDKIFIIYFGDSSTFPTRAPFNFLSKLSFKSLLFEPGFLSTLCLTNCFTLFTKLSVRRLPLVMVYGSGMVPLL